MYMIEKLSDQIAIVLANHLNLDEDNKEVLAYGAFAIIQTIWSVSLVIIFGLVFNVVIEAFIISLVGAILRKYSGGVHATSPNRCASIGAIMSVGLAIMLRVIKVSSIMSLSIVFAMLSFSVTYYCIFKYCPIDTPNKPIVKEETKIRLKKASLRTVHFFCVITLILYGILLSGEKYFLVPIITSVSGGLFNQSISLTPSGHIIILSIDKLIGYFGLSRLLDKGGDKIEE